MGAGLFEFSDKLVLFLNERLELGDFFGVLPLFVFAESEEVGDVLRAPAVEEEFVFAEDCLAEFFDLFRILTETDTDSGSPLLPGGAEDGVPFDVQVICGFGLEARDDIVRGDGCVGKGSGGERELRTRAAQTC